MKRICGWCGRELEKPNPLKPDEVTHGICAECKSKHFGHEEKKESEKVACQKNGDHR